MPPAYSNAPRDKSLPGLVFTLLIFLALGLAAWYRLPDLGLRPVHTDEAVLFTKFGEMVKTGHFDYDPSDYHGPVLHYITMAYGTLAGWGQAVNLTEADFRRVIAVMGLLLVLTPLLATDAFGRFGTVMAMLMTAVSPMMVFYSRYYIMEVPFVLWLALFMFSCWRFSAYQGWGWLVLAAASVGLMHGTKETFIINMAAMACGWVAVKVLVGGFEHTNRGMHLSIGKTRHFVSLPWLWGALIALFVSVLLFSGFFRFWDDVGQSFSTYLNYLKRSGGAGHEKPWHYYLSVLVYKKDTFVWTEIMIIVLAIIGSVSAFTGRFQRDEARKAFMIFLSVYALAALVAYSIIPYKTPWTILSVQHALTLLAGFGAQQLMDFYKDRFWRTAVTIVLMGGLYHLCSESMMTIRDRGVANLRGPYVYSHTTTSAVKMVNRILELAAFKKEGFTAQVINAQDGWPLPWYFRHLDKVGYQRQVPATLNASVIVVDQSLAPQVQAMLKSGDYVSDIYGLRPEFNVVLMVDKKLNDEFAAARAKP